MVFAVAVAVTADLRLVQCWMWEGHTLHRQPQSVGFELAALGDGNIVGIGGKITCVIQRQGGAGDRVAMMSVSAAPPVSTV